MWFQGAYVFHRLVALCFFRVTVLCQSWATCEPARKGVMLKTEDGAQHWDGTHPTTPPAMALVAEEKWASTCQWNICVYCSKTLHSFSLLLDSLQESHYELILSLQGASWWKTLLKLYFSVLNPFKADCWEVIIIGSGNNANHNNIFTEHSNHKYLWDKYYINLALLELQSSLVPCPYLKKFTS